MKKLDILYEDDYLIIVNKKHNLLTIGTNKEKNKTLYKEVADFIKKRHKSNKIFIVNRLDKETSGIVVFAKRFDIKEKMQLNWEKVRRFYLGIVEGKQVSRYIELNLKENKNEFKTYYDSKGYLTKTNIRLIKNYSKNSFIEIEILTGKKHQIRATMSYLKTPLVGDKKYGSKQNPYRRVMLHAYKIIFNHPVNNKTIIIETNVPSNFTKMVEAL